MSRSSWPPPRPTTGFLREYPPLEPWSSRSMSARTPRQSLPRITPSTSARPRPEFLSVRSYAPSGTLLWSTPVSAAPTDLLLGDDGLVYAFLSNVPGEIVGLSQATGTLKRDYINLESGGELLLRQNGRLFANTSSRLYALPTTATDYDPAAPWPVKQHDNMLQSESGSRGRRRPSSHRQRDVQRQTSAGLVGADAKCQSLADAGLASPARTRRG